MRLCVPSPTVQSKPDNGETVKHVRSILETFYSIIESKASVYILEACHSIIESKPSVCLARSYLITGQVFALHVRTL